MSGAIISDCPSNVTVSDCIKARVVLRRRWNINESELSEIDTWPAREKEDEKSGSPYNSKEFENGMISIDTGISVVYKQQARDIYQTVGISDWSQENDFPLNDGHRYIGYSTRLHAPTHSPTYTSKAEQKACGPPLERLSFGIN